MLYPKFPFVTVLKGRIHPQGWFFLGIFAACTTLLFLVSISLGWIGVIMTLWCLAFFRDPDRVPPLVSDIILSPADGLITTIALVEGTLPYPELQERGAYKRISIFMSVFDVHVNRIPMTGTILASYYTKGRFKNVISPNASAVNERHCLILEHPKGLRIGCVQVAGLLARRIRWDALPHDNVMQGMRYGIIRFGSRLDIYIPEACPCYVQEGQRAVGGETILCGLPMHGEMFGDHNAPNNRDEAVVQKEPLCI